jgi:exodeoxyribonuclease VII large subunit
MKKSPLSGTAVSSPLQADLFSAPAEEGPSGGQRPEERASAELGPPIVSVPPPKTYPWRAQAVSAAPAQPAAERPAPAVPVVLTVGELTRQLKGALERSFGRVCVRGEVSGYRGPNARGHLYFNLKDADACLEVRIWSSTAQRLKFALKEGLEVVVEGNIELYEPQGRYSLIVSRIEPSGEGALALAFAQLKEKLSAEGLFGPQRTRPHRPIPFLPKRIGVVTSRTGAALWDFLRVLHQRNPRLSVLLCDARVQGDGSAFEVASAIRRLARTNVDVIVVTRGGGSVEDLWTFNEERVARAIFACPVPVVSAIGHEVDFTIADFVADLRAPTPSAAAERLAPVLAEVQLQLAMARGRLRKALERAVLAGRQRLSASAGKLADPRRLLAQKRLHLSDDADRMERAMRALARARRERHRGLADRLAKRRPQARLAELRARLAGLKSRLLSLMREYPHKARAGLAKRTIAFERAAPKNTLKRLRGEFAAKVAALGALSPLNVMARGYSVVFRRPEGHLVRSSSELRPGDEVAIRFLAPGCTTLEECEEVDATVKRILEPKKALR